ncbi:hypothetical protein TBK1r_21340 [Stieleria magnilauensis]|uniref:Uncharacterized protein n=1 Tax=Stieleria magnilauensis TaxID=2527963 RepID=A0ABX5XTI0_9BACT|nr:hypothetical protein TBK1r_21340 [Planctomycetes bacterium TBK1r]
MNAIKTTAICDYNDDKQSVSLLGKFSSKVQDRHLCKLAVVYVRQSTQRRNRTPEPVSDVWLTC